VAATLDVLRQAIMSTHEKGARVYVVDPRNISDDIFGWIEAITGLTPQDLEFIRGSKVFRCGGYDFIQVNPL
jgi:hypothetical protein